MTNKLTKILKLSQHIDVDDKIRIAGLMCNVVRVKFNADLSLMTLDLNIVGAPIRTELMTIMMRSDVPVVVRR